MWSEGTRTQAAAGRDGRGRAPAVAVSCVLKVDESRPRRNNLGQDNVLYKGRERGKVV